MRKILTIMHTNDTHSQIESYAKRATIIKKVRAQNKQENVKTMVVDSGDVISGSIYYNLYEGVVEANLLNKLEYDLITLGNHEFDRGSRGLAKFLSELKVPVISSNINIDNDNILKQFKTNGDLNESEIIQIHELKVGFMALTTMTTKDTAEPSCDTIINDPIEVAKAKVKAFKMNNVDLIVCLSHLGLKADQTLAKKISEIDVIIGGHSHDLLTKPIVIEHNNRETLILQAKDLGEYIGQLNIYQNQGKFVYEYEMHQVNNYTEDVVVSEYINEVIKLSAIKTKQIIGKTLVNLDGRREIIRNYETNLGNLIADAYLKAAQDQGFAVDFALINSGGIRKTIDKGDITYKDIIDVIPFNKQLTIIKVSGKQLIDSIKNGLLMQVANLKIIYDHDELKVFIKRKTKLEQINLKQNYLVATNNFVALGRDNYIGFNPNQIVATNLKADVDILIEYIKLLKQPFTYKTSARIVKNN